jgi:hypothetical protein
MDWSEGCCTESEQGRDVGHRRQPIEVFLAFESLEVLSKVRCGDEFTLARMGLVHEPVPEDELQVKNEEGRSQTVPHLRINLVLEASLNPFVLTKHAAPGNGTSWRSPHKAPSSAKVHRIWVRASIQLVGR